MQPQYHFFSLSNAQLCPFAIAFKLLLDVDSVLLEIGNGQVNIADFVAVCEYHPQIAEVILSKEFAFLDRLDRSGAFVQQGRMIRWCWIEDCMDVFLYLGHHTCHIFEHVSCCCLPFVWHPLGCCSALGALAGGLGISGLPILVQTSAERLVVI